MPEILTESFCERCGTRYTFESGAPRGPRLKGVKVLSRGLKNFVMSDDTSLDEAMAAARSESDREVTTHQLDAFHKTFNFCMSCRQYTCGNCWNEAEGKCLSCAPHLGHDILQAPFPHLDPAAGLETNGGNGGPNGHHEAHPAADAMAWPTTDLLRDDQPTPDVAFGLDATVEPGAAPAEEAPAWDLIRARADEFDAGEIAGTGFDEGEELEPIDAAARLADIGAAPIVERPVTPVAPTSDAAEDPDERAAAAAEQTADLLRRFRPGESLDDELAAFDAELATAEPEVEPIAATGPEPELHPVVAVAPEPVVTATPEPEPEPEPIVATAPEPEPEPVVAAAPEPEPEAFVAAAPEPEPFVAAESEPEPVVAAEEAARRDVVEQPTWRIVAPDVPAPGAGDQPVPVPPPGPFRAPAEPTTASADPTWPAQPEWPADRGAGGLPSFGRPAVATGGIEQLWAESAREVTAAPVATAARSGVQACVSCGLSLSATARFCRRCGTRQG